MPSGAVTAHTGAMSTLESNAVTSLTDEESWKLLGAAKFGRLAIVIGGEPDIFPINIVTNGKSLFFRSAEGTKLFGAALGRVVAFETDHVDDASAWSIVVIGTPRITERDTERSEAEALGLRPWVPTIKHTLVAIDVSGITGHRFLFGPEPADTELDSTD